MFSVTESINSKIAVVYPKALDYMQPGAWAAANKLTTFIHLSDSIEEVDTLRGLRITGFMVEDMTMVYPDMYEALFRSLRCDYPDIISIPKKDYHVVLNTVRAMAGEGSYRHSQAEKIMSHVIVRTTRPERSLRPWEEAYVALSRLEEQDVEYPTFGFTQKELAYLANVVKTDIVFGKTGRMDSDVAYSIRNDGPINPLNPDESGFWLVPLGRDNGLSYIQ